MTCTYRSTICQGKILAKTVSKTRQIGMRIDTKMGGKKTRQNGYGPKSDSDSWTPVTGILFTKGIGRADIPTYALPPKWSCLP